MSLCGARPRPRERGVRRAAAVAVSLVLLAGALAGGRGSGSGFAEDGPPESRAKQLVARLGDADEAKRTAAADGLVALGADSVPDLVAGLDDRELREAIAGVIVRLGPVAKDAAPRLTNLLRGAESPSRAAVMRAAAALGAEAAGTIELLGTIAASERASDRGTAMDAFARVLAATAAVDSRATETPAVVKAIAAGCDWLVRHQSKDGLWESDGFDARCSSKPACSGRGAKGLSFGVSGLALRALLEAPASASVDGREAAIESAVRRIVRAQDTEGCFGPKISPKFQYCHAAATLAILSALRHKPTAETRSAAQLAVAFVLASQNTGLAWRYGIRDGDNDTSVTTWMCQVLAEAEEAGIVTDGTWRDGAEAWADKMTDPDDGQAGYQRRGGPPARTGTTNRAFPPDLSESTTACCLLIGLDTGRAPGKDLVAERQFERLAQLPPDWSRPGTVDLYYWLQGTRAMHLRGGTTWVAWRDALLGALLPAQFAEAEYCARGTWPAADPWSSEGGRIYSTCAALLALEQTVHDPATFPAVPRTARKGIESLEKVAQDPSDPELQRIAYRALLRIRAAHKP